MSDSELPAVLNVPYTFVSALFYGLYLSTVFHCLRWLVFADEGWKMRRRINWAMLSITIILWALSTLSKALDLRSSMIVVENQTTPAVDPLQSATTLLWMGILSVSLSLYIRMRGHRLDASTQVHKRPCIYPSCRRCPGRCVLLTKLKHDDLTNEYQDLSLLDYLSHITLGRCAARTFVARRVGAYDLASIH
jgi:hypothetical protein